jgi:hypothetical protein
MLSSTHRRAIVAVYAGKLYERRRERTFVSGRFLGKR